MNIRKMQTAAGGPLKLTSEELKYLEWSKLTPELKREYRINRAKTYLLSGPNITNFWEAFQTYIGNRDPENPHLQTGDVPNPGMKNPKDIIRLFRATGTSGKFKPSLDGTLEFVGQWFTDNVRKSLRYASSTFKKAKISKESNPVELLVVEIPASEINKYKASELLKRRTDVEYEPTEDFLIPLDYPRLKYSIEGLTGNLLLDMHLKLPIEKQGGKMNILEFLKNGSGIHIKEKNKGKFTSYCGGKVTDECIRKAKASGNPTLVKRATFALNARRWKHKFGGILKAQEGTKVDSLLISGLLNGIMNFASTYSKNKLLDYQAKMLKALNEIEYNDFIKLAVLNAQQKANLQRELWKQSYLNGETLDLSFNSDIVNNHIKNQFLNQEIAGSKNKLNLQNSLIDALIASEKSNNFVDAFGGLMLIGTTALLNYKPKLSNIQETNLYNTSYILPKLTTNTWTPNTTLSTSLGLYSTPLTDSHKFWNINKA